MLGVSLSVFSIPTAVCVSKKSTKLIKNRTI